MLEEMMNLYMTTDVEAPLTRGICVSTMKEMLDCNDVDGDCSIETYCEE